MAVFKVHVKYTYILLSLSAHKYTFVLFVKLRKLIIPLIWQFICVCAKREQNSKCSVNYIHSQQSNIYL